MRFLTVILCALLLGSCASVDNSKKSITLDKASRAYENAIRWGKFEAADSMRRLPDDSRVPDYEVLKNIKVTGYALTSQQENNERNELTRDVEIHYYNLENMKERTLSDRQHWVYDPVEKYWYITTPLPLFR